MLQYTAKIPGTIRLLSPGIYYKKGHFENAENMAHTRQVVSQIKTDMTVGIFIGPEGGFAEEEVEQAINTGAYDITLGKRILRTETAGMTVLSILMFLLEGKE